MIQYFSILLILIGVYGLLTEKNIIKLIVAINIVELGLNLFIVSVGYIKNGIAPILTAVDATDKLNFVDPLPQALVLTAIVIGVGTTALGLAFARKIHRQYGTFNLDKMEVDKQ